jgi:hypothetical protein
VHIKRYFKKLFGASTQNNFSTMEDITSDIPQIFTMENSILRDDFIEEEFFVYRISHMKHKKAPGPRRVPS